jgi:hypothetical protein
MGQVICDKLLDVLPKPPNAVVFELPASWGGAAAVSTRSGAVVKLAVMSGLICGNLHYKYKCDLIPVPVNTWKGQLPKEICNRRVEAIMNFKPGKTTHELDAIGIGLWTLGAFK